VAPEVLIAGIVDAAEKAAVREVVAPDRTGSCYFPEETR
jgi:hypothetical protein